MCLKIPFQIDKNRAHIARSSQISLNHLLQDNDLQTVDRIKSYKVPEPFCSTQVQFLS